MSATFQFPCFSNLFSTPRTVTHKRHERASTTLALATRRVAFIRIRARAFRYKARTVTPGTIIPVVLDPSFTTGTTGWHPGFRTSCRIIKSAPGAALHTLRHGTLATSAVVSRIECPFEVPLKLTPLQLPPGGTRAYRAFLFYTFLFSHMRLRFAERSLHLHRITIALPWINLDSLFQHFNQLGPDA